MMNGYDKYRLCMTASQNKSSNLSSGKAMIHGVKSERPSVVFINDCVYLAIWMNSDSKQFEKVFFNDLIESSIQWITI